MLEKSTNPKDFESYTDYLNYNIKCDLLNSYNTVRNLCNSETSLKCTVKYNIGYGCFDINMHHKDRVLKVKSYPILIINDCPSKFKDFFKKELFCVEFKITEYDDEQYELEKKFE